MSAGGWSAAAKAVAAAPSGPVLTVAGPNEDGQDRAAGETTVRPAETIGESGGETQRTTCARNTPATEEESRERSTAVIGGEVAAESVGDPGIADEEGGTTVPANGPAPSLWIIKVIFSSRSLRASLFQHVHTYVLFLDCKAIFEFCSSNDLRPFFVDLFFSRDGVRGFLVD